MTMRWEEKTSGFRIKPMAFASGAAQVLRVSCDATPYANLEARPMKLETDLSTLDRGHRLDAMAIADQRPGYGE